MQHCIQWVHSVGFGLSLKPDMLSKHALPVLHWAVYQDSALRAPGFSAPITPSACCMAFIPCAMFCIILAP